MTRPRIVLDTNVLISGIIFGGAPRRVLEQVIAGKVDCFLSTPILDELRSVLQRPKFGFTTEQTLQTIEELVSLCSIVTPSMQIGEITSDPDDNHVIECALHAHATIIVSGDAHLLALKEFEGIQILSPRDFLSKRKVRP
ncbi:MAG: putative toxin-antitoxin system toxin component, PIN family [Planctomycetota bacterium]